MEGLKILFLVLIGIGIIINIIGWTDYYRHRAQRRPSVASAGPADDAR
jgi:hypothetical protein